MSDIVERPKPFEIADSLLEMAQDVEIGHADRLGVPAASFLRESADCINRQSAEIERLLIDNDRLVRALTGLLDAVTPDEQASAEQAARDALGQE